MRLDGGNACVERANRPDGGDSSEILNIAQSSGVAGVEEQLTRLSPVPWIL